MSKIFIVSDTHFSHKNIINFTDKSNQKIRPFESLEAMNQTLVDNWNRVVRPEDKVYHLGDFCLNRSALPIAARLNGHKVLVRGNHDVFKAEEYLVYFKDVLGSFCMHDYLLTHIPVHPEQKWRYKGNIHGHLHERNLPDPWYFCVSVEQIGFAPVELDWVVERIKGAIEKLP